MVGWKPAQLRTRRASTPARLIRGAEHAYPSESSAEGRSEGGGSGVSPDNISRAWRVGQMTLGTQRERIKWQHPITQAHFVDSACQFRYDYVAISEVPAYKNPIEVFDADDD